MSINAIVTTAELLNPFRAAFNGTICALTNIATLIHIRTAGEKMSLSEGCWPGLFGWTSAQVIVIVKANVNQPWISINECLITCHESDFHSGTNKYERVAINAETIKIPPTMIKYVKFSFRNRLTRTSVGTFCSRPYEYAVKLVSEFCMRKKSNPQTGISICPES